MESWTKYDISKVMSYVQTEDPSAAVPYCSGAKKEFTRIKEKIKLDHGRKIDPVLELIDAVVLQRVLKKETINESVSLFNNYIKPFLEEEERKKDRDETNADNGTYRAPDADSKQAEHVPSCKEYTKIPPLERGAEVLALAFRNLYFNGAWHDAFKELMKMTNAEKLACECLLRIVQKAFEINKQEAEQQLSTAEECAKQIVRKGKLIDRNCPEPGVEKSTSELLRRYRYLHADLATERLKKVLLQEVKTLLFNDYSLEFKGDRGLASFTCKCAEVIWLMCVEDPPINTVHEDNLETLDCNIYEIVRGKPCKAVVWPALKQEGYTNTLAPGILWSKD